MKNNAWAVKAPDLIKDWTRIINETMVEECAGGSIHVDDLSAKVAARLVDEYGGQQIYIPYHFVRASRLASAIFEDWEKYSPSELAKLHKVNIHRVYKLYRIGRRMDSERRQLDMFGLEAPQK